MLRKKENSRLFKEDISGLAIVGTREVEIKWRAGTLTMDEPSFNGGKDVGPDPFTAILSGLVACTINTLRMYIKRKDWDITNIKVDVNMSQQDEPFITTIYRTVIIGDPITEEQREKLYYIAVNCPAAKFLGGQVDINTSL